MAYSQKAEDALMTWQQPVYDKFIAKVGMFDDMYDVQVYFIPMYVGNKQVFYEKSMKKLRDEKRDDLNDYILFYKGELEPYGSTLKMSNSDLPYFFVLDKEGKIIYSTSGSYTEEKMEAIEEVLE
jgi:hypothetical protein